MGSNCGEWSYIVRQIKGTNMQNVLNATKRGVAAFSAGAIMLAGTATMAAEKVSADFSVSYNSHFISYGSDVWSGGSDFFGRESTTFVDGAVTFQVTDAFSINLGAWADVNNNASSRIGGNLQEIDVWIGASYMIDKVTLGATYQNWFYSGDVEEIVDLSIGFDDSGLYGGDFALNPELLWHIRTSGNGTQATGSVLVLSVGPEFPLSEALTLTIPAGVGFLMDKDYHGGTKSGYAYSYVGASLDYPLSFISPDFGAWALNATLLAYFTDDKAIPNNPKENFVTGSVGLSLSF